MNNSEVRNSFTTFVPAGSNGLATPFDVLFGPDGNLYVTEGGPFFAGNAVKRYNGTTGASLGTFVVPASGGLSQASGTTFGPDGHLYVASFGTDQVLRYNGTTGAFIDAFVTAGSGGLDGPVDLLFGRDSRLYVLSSNTSSVLRYNGATGQFENVFIASGTAGLFRPNFFVLTADTGGGRSCVRGCVGCRSPSTTQVRPSFAEAIKPIYDLERSVCWIL